MDGVPPPQPAVGLALTDKLRTKILSLSVSQSLPHSYQRSTSAHGPHSHSGLLFRAGWNLGIFLSSGRDRTSGRSSCYPSLSPIFLVGADLDDASSHVKKPEINKFDKGYDISFLMSEERALHPKDYEGAGPGAGTSIAPAVASPSPPVGLPRFFLRPSWERVCSTGTQTRPRRRQRPHG